MYCAICKDLMVGQKLLTNEDGYDYPYDAQLCQSCRPKDQLTEKELESILNEAKIKV